MNSIEIPDFEDQFENVRLFIKRLRILELEEVQKDAFSEVSPYTSIITDLDLSGFPKSKDIVGKLDIMFRNQGNDFGLVLSVDMNLRARAIETEDPANTLCKTVQYLFDWMTKWVEERDIRDQSGGKFIMPAFQYSRTQFEEVFQH